MSAGTVVMSGGVVAAVILLCIITMLCFCRLQHYCCRCDVSKPVAAPVLDARPGIRSVDGVLGTLLPLTFDPSLTHSSCPTCSHFYRHGDVCPVNMCLCVAHTAPFQGLTALGSMVRMNYSAKTHAISTDV